jgi:Icc-related predicted phosphoesterase
MYNRHAGFEPYNKVIKKYRPLLAICGHMHEYQGIKKLGRTTVIATGAAFQGKAALIDIEGQKIKSIKFLK